MKQYLSVILLMLICFFLYIAGIDYGRPLPKYNPSTVHNGWLNSETVFHPDAYDYASRPYSMLLRGISPLKPNFYHNPSLTIQLNILMTWLTNATSQYKGPYNPQEPLPSGTKLDCEIPNPPKALCLRQIAPFQQYVVARYLSALMVLIALSLAYTSGRLIHSHQVGVLASILVGLSPLAVQNAHYENPGATTLAVSSAAVLLNLIILKRNSSSHKLHFVAGLLVGLSIAARYNAGVVIVVFLIASIIPRFIQRQLSIIMIGGAAIPIGFVLGTPGALFEFRVFFDDVRYILFWYTSIGGGAGWTSPNSLQSIYYYWRYLFLIGLGPFALIAGTFGMLKLLKCKTNDYRFWIGVSFSAYVLSYSVIALSSLRLNNNLLVPMIMPLALLASYGYSEFSRSWVFCKYRFFVRIIACSILLYKLVLGFLLASMFARTDNRMVAQQWIYDNIPIGTYIHRLGSYNVPIDPADYPSQQTYGASASSDDPLWSSPIIVYSDAYPHAVLRDPSLTQDPSEYQKAKSTYLRLQEDWFEIARFNRTYWLGQDLAPDDISFWHQMEIIIFCNPEKCPVPLD